MYYLLPFRFHVFRNQELLTNDLGDYLLLPRGSVQRIVDREVLPEEELYKNLTASFFIYKKPDRKSTRLNSSHKHRSRMPSSA